MHTPGHTAGCCCYIVENAIFTGDTIMHGSVGRTDFPTGSYAQLMDSLKKISDLSGDYIVYPGHEAQSTLEYERENNPYLRSRADDFDY
jgi:glyoxylase-like metal-dependent hydrolase (beta-lactamase superfamily II)